MVGTHTCWLTLNGNNEENLIHRELGINAYNASYEYLRVYEQWDLVEHNVN